ncbi:hypothetical protein KSP40_PGU012109 [Platanthera guangdongensis]|uniref:Uncharacterized protein n=1 Tax=Platanthera guangdongensis TaxID=2320717 RepID=A0ABR2MPL7_9ASPA
MPLAISLEHSLVQAASPFPASTVVRPFPSSKATLRRRSKPPLSHSHWNHQLMRSTFVGAQTAVHEDCAGRSPSSATAPATSCFSTSLSSRKMGLDVRLPERQDRLPLFVRCFSTVFTSVHGEKPSSEYARRRKQSLETLFGHILGRHGSKTFFAYSRFGPFLALYRAAIIFFQVAKLTVSHFFVQDIDKRAAKVPGSFVCSNFSLQLA